MSHVSHSVSTLDLMAMQNTQKPSPFILSVSGVMLCHTWVKTTKICPHEIAPNPLRIIFSFPQFSIDWEPQSHKVSPALALSEAT